VTGSVYVTGFASELRLLILCGAAIQTRAEAPLAAQLRPSRSLANSEYLSYQTDQHHSMQRTLLPHLGVAASRTRSGAQTLVVRAVMSTVPMWSPVVVEGL
jgi:hypothetical protein